MSLSDPKVLFGIHSVAAIKRTNGVPYGIAKVLSSSNIALSGEQVELYGGAQRFPYKVEDANITTEIKLGFKQLEDWMFEVFLGKAPTATSTPGTSGTVSTLTNKKGSSVMHATTGIASVALKSGQAAHLKFSKYVVVAASATTVHVYAYSDVDFARGTDKEYVNDGLRITSAALTITASTPVEIPDFGLELTGGSGTIGMTTDDTATFEVHPPYTKKMEVTIGGPSDTFPEFNLIAVGQQAGNGEMFEADVFRCKGSGLPIGFTEKAFSESEVTAKAFYDSSRSGVLSIRWTQPS